MTDRFKTTRRRFLQGGASAVAAAGLMPAASRLAWGQADDFPSRNLEVMVATREGGGADRNLRLFWSVWQKYLPTEMEASFYPGAAGRVGYQQYMALAEPDCYTLLFGNMGPEVLNWVVEPPQDFDFPGDYIYWQRVDADPSCIFVSNDSPFQTIDDLLEEGTKRELTVAVSRIAHPACVGTLALAEEAGAKVNLIPLSGGRNTRAGVTSGEQDCGSLPVGGIARRSDAFRILCIFDDENLIPDRTNNAPTVNEHFGMNLPPLVSARAFAIKTEAIEQYPERFEILQETAAKVFDDPDYKEAVLEANAVWEFIKHGGVEECEQYVENIMEIGRRFEDTLRGNI